jgi:hypothetical protein
MTYHSVGTFISFSVSSIAEQHCHRAIQLFIHMQLATPQETTVLGSFLVALEARLTRLPGRWIGRVSNANSSE